MYNKRNRINGLERVYAQKYLRFFQARFKKLITVEIKELKEKKAAEVV